MNVSIILQLATIQKTCDCYIKEMTGTSISPREIYKYIYRKINMNISHANSWIYLLYVKDANRWGSLQIFNKKVAKRIIKEANKFNLLSSIISKNSITFIIVYLKDNLSSCILDVRKKKHREWKICCRVRAFSSRSACRFNEGVF